MKKIIISTALVLSSLHSAEYIIPPEWDNTLNSVNSKAEVLITNLLTQLSTNSYLVAGKSRRYKCVRIPKIRCANGYTPDIQANIKQNPALRDSLTDKLISTFSVDIRTENAGTQWNVCGSATGSIIWDKSTLSQNATTKDLTYIYIPNNDQFNYYYFTNATGNTISASGINGGSIKGSNNSYMIIETEQVCK